MNEHAARTSERVRAAVLADQPVLAEGLHELLRSADDVHVVWTGTGNDEPLRHIADNLAEVVVVGVGAELPMAARHLLDSNSTNGAFGAPHLVCVVPKDLPLSRALINYGDGVAVLSTDASAEELLETVRAIGEGRRPAEPLAGATGGGVSNGDARLRPSHQPLTARERDVLRLLTLGLSTAEIAQRLDVSSNTVRTHVRNLMIKLGAHNRLQLTAIATAEGLTPSEESTHNLQW
jgi:DNA-binding NarL/FixJ family response regulator